MFALRPLASLLALVCLVLVATGGLAADAHAVDAAASPDDWVYALMAEEGSCSLADAENPLELCGGALSDEYGYGPVVSAALMLPRDTCSTLLEELFAQQTCDQDDFECQRVRRGLPAPANAKIGASRSVNAHPGLWGLDLATFGIERRVARAKSDRVPRWLGSAPPLPPPRPILA